MKKYTQKEVDNFDVIDGIKQCPYLYLVFDERARLMPNEQCVCLLANDDKKEALEFAEENRGVVFGYVTQGEKILNNTEEQLN